MHAQLNKVKAYLITRWFEICLLKMTGKSYDKLEKPKPSLVGVNGALDLFLSGKQ